MYIAMKELEELIGAAREVVHRRGELSEDRLSKALKAWDNVQRPRPPVQLSKDVEWDSWTPTRVSTPGTLNTLTIS
jgi:hypothetical protein